MINYNDKCWYCFYHYLSFVNHLPKRENSRGLRRVYNFNSSNSLIVYKEVIFDINKDEIKYKDNVATLTKNESKILTILLENREKIVSREDIIAALWQSDNFIDENTLSVNVNRLRSKLKDIGIADFIITKKGKGYMV